MLNFEIYDKVFWDFSMFYLLKAIKTNYDFFKS